MCKKLRDEIQKEKILNTEGDTFNMLLFYWVDDTKKELKSIHKSFNKENYDEIAEFFKVVPTLSELEIFFNKMPITIYGEILNCDILDDNDLLSITTLFGSIKNINTFNKKQMVKYDNKNYILWDLIVKLHEDIN